MTANAGHFAALVFTGGWRDVMEPEPIFQLRRPQAAAALSSRATSASATSISSANLAPAKSTFLFNLAMADIYAGEGVAVIDPHGDLATDILDAIPRSRINDVCYLDAGETEYPVGFNPATRIAPERRALAASGMVAAFKHLWSDSWGPRLEHFLFHGIAALISRKHATLLDLPRFYTDDAFRERIVAKITDPETLRFWQEEFPSYTKTAARGGRGADLEQSRTIHRLAAPAAHPRSSRSAPRPRVHDEQSPHLDR